MTEPVDGMPAAGSLPTADARLLLERAREARARAYAPYSRYPVGAALLDADGTIHLGTNVENASYGLTICAERVAVFRAIAEGARSFRAIAIAGPDDEQPCPPCGSCRQVLHEFAPSMVVVVGGASGSIGQLRLNDLLPDAFGPASLGERSPQAVRSDSDTPPQPATP